MRNQFAQSREGRGSIVFFSPTIMNGILCCWFKVRLQAENRFHALLNPYNIYILCSHKLELHEFDLRLMGNCVYVSTNYQGK